jgi:serine/threonine protein phosphatase PrpC
LGNNLPRSVGNQPSGFIDYFMTISLSHVAVSAPGRRFPVNEDRWLADPDLGLYVVADGMADERAPQMIIDRLPGMMNQPSQSPATWSDPAVAEQVRSSLVQLSAAIRDESEAHPDQPAMAATLVMALFRPNQALIAHLGTCRAYLWREGFLEQLTRDQSVVQRYLGLGVLKPDQASRFPLGGGPTCYLGMKGEPTPAIRTVPIFPGDRLLLTSAGLTNVVTDWQIHDLLTQTKNPQEACDRLEAAAKEAGARDSTTVLMVSVGDN